MEIHDIFEYSENLRTFNYEFWYMKFGGRLKKKNVMTFQFRRDSLFGNNISEIVWNINSFVILLLIDLYTKL